MAPRLRKFSLTAHVTFSVGWLGAVIGFLALAIVGLASEDAETTRAAYLVMEPIGWYVLLPLALTSLLSGLVQSLGTTWGLFRHYWVVFKLLINAIATILLLMYMETLDYLADVGSNPTFSARDLHALRDPSPILHSVLALALLLVATTLAVYKPRGMTRYGQRKPRRVSQPERIED